MHNNKLTPIFSEVTVYKALILTDKSTVWKYLLYSRFKVNRSGLFFIGLGEIYAPVTDAYVTLAKLIS